jgi:multidrug transporter EmrE-like cation transporter
MWLFFTLCLVSNVVATIFNKQYGITSNLWYAVGAIVSTIVGSIMWSIVMRKGAELSVANSLLGIAMLIGIFFIGIIGYHEALTWNKVAGVALGVIAIILIVK